MIKGVVILLKTIHGFRKCSKIYKFLTFFIIILLIPLAYSISIKDLIARYSFSTTTVQMNVTNQTDFMIDKNNNGINDTLVFELTTNNANGTFIFVINLFDKDGVLTNETNKTLGFGTNKLNITFSSIFLTQNQFNYSIKVYNASRSLKYRKDNILTQSYAAYEEGYRILNITDEKINKTLRVNVTLSSPSNGTHRTTVFLKYNNSILSSKEDKSITSSINHLIFYFDNESIKRTHYIGNFSISSVKVGRRTIKTDFSTAFYDYKDFAATSYIYNFTDNGTDSNKNSQYDFLEINASLQIFKESNYTTTTALYDLFDNLIEIKNNSIYLGSGKNIVPMHFNGTKIYEKKLNGPYALKLIELYENGTLIDQIKDAYTTSNYNFNDFEQPDLPDLKANISVSDGYRYGINNITINFTFKNIGNKHAFNVFTEIFDNKTFSKVNKSNIVNANSQIIYQFDFTNISDFEITAIADLQDFVEELNESNNAERVTIKLNKKPNLASVNNISVNETDKIIINLSASDPNEDNLTYSVNLSKFSINSNIFEWDTKTTDSGNYTLIAIASDGFLNDSKIFKIIVLDAPDKDVDNDGIDDDIDKLIGDEKSVNTSTLNLTAFIGDSRNLSKLFNQSMRVRLMDGNSTIAEFEFNFSAYRLNLRNMTIDKQQLNKTGSLFIRGLKMPDGKTKILYLDKVNSTIDGVCIKDTEISAINEISNECNSNNEFKVECDGTLQNSYSCIYNSTLNKYKVEGLKHSGVIQIAYTKPASSSSSSSTSLSGSGGGGGGGTICISDWKCSKWTQCVDNIQTRKCNDINQCAFPTNKPLEVQECFGEVKSVNVIKPLEFVDDAINKIKQNIKTAKFSSVTGQSVKQINKNFNLGIFIVFVEIVIIVGTYLVIRKTFLKNL